MKSAGYPIRVVSRLTGVGIDTLRAWERRYGAVEPARSARANETRLYSDAEVARLRRLAEAVAAGHRIGHVASLSDTALSRLLEPSSARAGTAAPARRHAGALHTSPLDAALITLDTAAIDREFAHLAAALPPRELVEDVVLPALRRAGESWMKRRGGIAFEHVLSSTLRGLLSSLLRIHARVSAAPRVLFTTLEGDRHEIGILSAAMLAATSGVAVSYLGPDLPAAELLSAVTTSGARVVVLGLTFSEDDAATAERLKTVVQRLPRSVELWIGGRRAAELGRGLSRRVVVLDDFDAYMAQIARVGGRAH